MIKLEGKLAKYKELISYFFIACSGVMVQLIVSSITQNFFGFSFQLSIALGYVIAFIIGFFLTKIFAFNQRHSKNSFREGIKFLLVSLISGIITVKGAYYCLHILREYTIFEKEQLVFGKSIDFGALISHFFGMGMSFVVNFVSHKHFTFRTTGLYHNFKLFFKGN
ncbi:MULTISPECIES: GtrA family protein [Emticicia]|uniref:GtrA family protein n=1 Tax=Emticicia TaxID=312278 RepID=UPI000C75FBAB|nr:MULTISPECIES: GtrA family protein [Emticicia]PLK46202.1 GtrA family protein [Emticicia sp. TH156]